MKDTLSQPGTATGITNYTYDLLDRLTEATTTGTYPSHYVYELDGAGNRLFVKANPTGSTGGTESSYSNNTGNETTCRAIEKNECTKLPTTEISGYSFDGAGNETSITGYNDPASTNFLFNNDNQLEGLTPPSTAEQKLTYNNAGQNSLTGLGTTTLQNSTLGLTKQTNETGTSYYERTPGGLLLDERLPAGTSYNPLYDSQGDVIGLLNSSGELKQAIHYGPYGENTSTTGTLPYSPTNDPFLFQSGYHAPGGNAGAGNVPNNLYHYGERYYDPTTGKWTQQDPAGGLGTYMFAGDDPVNNADPTGEFYSACHDPTAPCGIAAKIDAEIAAKACPIPTQHFAGKPITCAEVFANAGKTFNANSNATLRDICGRYMRAASAANVPKIIENKAVAVILGIFGYEFSGSVAKGACG